MHRHSFLQLPRLLSATGRVIRYSNSVCDYVRAELFGTGQVVHGPSCPGIVAMWWVKFLSSIKDELNPITFICRNSSVRTVYRLCYERLILGFLVRSLCTPLLFFKQIEYSVVDIRYYSWTPTIRMTDVWRISYSKLVLRQDSNL